MKKVNKKSSITNVEVSYSQPKQRDKKTFSISLSSPTFGRHSFWFPLCKSLNKTFYRLGIGFAVSRYTATLYIYNSWVDLSNHESLNHCLNIGCGGFIHPLWDCHDYPALTPYYKSIQSSSGKNFFPIDLTDHSYKLPYEDNSVSLIYCSHTLEHIPVLSISYFLKESFRTLAPEGVLRIVLPDMHFPFVNAKSLVPYGLDSDKFIKSIYIASFRAFSPSTTLDSKDLISSAIRNDFSLFEYINDLKSNYNLSDKFDPKHPENHITPIDASIMSKLAKDEGFTKIVNCSANQSISPVFANSAVFDTSEPSISIFIDIQK